MMSSPLQSTPLFMIGPVPVTDAVLVTWVIMAVLVLGAWLMSRQLALRPSARQAALELLVDTVDGQIRATTGASPEPFRAFIGTLFVYILIANWSSLIPGVEAPTAQLETDAGLAVLVFLSVIWFGTSGLGLAGYLRSFAAPNPVMIPLNILESVTRTFSMFVRQIGRAHV